jgi:ribosomal protein S18 acetylase RimI-like enzyme
MFVFAHDKERLWKHFQQDPVLFALHIGDLDDFFFDHCQWAASYSTRRHPIIEDVILIYSGGDNPVVAAFGVGDRFLDLLAETLDILPDRFFGHFQARCRDVFKSRYTESPLGTNFKMRLEKLATAPEIVGYTVVRLTESHLPQLSELYSRAYPENYFVPRMLQTGRYFGVVTGDRLVAVAGVHVVSDRYNIAVLGNITTDPDFRGRHFAGLVTHRLSAELQAEGKLVCLNVRADNLAAIRCYEQLGFVTTHQYEESLFELAPPEH